MRHANQYTEKERLCCLEPCFSTDTRTPVRINPLCSHISGTQSFHENLHVDIHLPVVYNWLVLLIGHLVACSARTRADKQTNTDRETDTPSTVSINQSINQSLHGPTRAWQVHTYTHKSDKTCRERSLAVQYRTMTVVPGRY